ncbi:MAG TPA: hypothetical protein VHT24_13160 [Pseudacidobacterium sp.]|nr:hypothetical protein [Pseudacidobacterium sp.]
MFERRMATMVHLYRVLPWRKDGYLFGNPYGLLSSAFPSEPQSSLQNGSTSTRILLHWERCFQ